MPTPLPAMPDPGTGPAVLAGARTRTFLFTDIEGSTRLWEQHPEAMRRALAWHDALLRDCIERWGGHVFTTMGDSFHAAFREVSDALAAAVEAQLAFEGSKVAKFEGPEPSNFPTFEPSNESAP